MIKIFEFLLHGCWHKYGEPYGRKTNHYDMSFGRPSYMYTTQSVRCEKCGHIKSARAEQ